MATFSGMATGNPSLPAFHPQTVLRDWGGGQAFRLADATSGVCVFGATGSGKTSGPAKHLAYGYLAAGFGGLVLCAKKEERQQWQQWAAETGREGDLVIVDASGKLRFNFLEWEASRADASGGLTINIVAILDEIAGALARAAGKAEGGGGDNKFWEDALHHMNTNLVDLSLFAGLRVSLPLMRSIVNSAPQSLAQIEDVKWQETSACAAILREADQATMEAADDIRADFEECRNYWLLEYPLLSDRTRSIITLSFSMLVRPLITRPLRKLFSTDTNVKPEDAFAGKIIIVDLPVQDFRLAGRVASLAWKFCFQVAVLRRTPPANGYLRPVFLGPTRRRISSPILMRSTRRSQGRQADAPSISRKTVRVTGASLATMMRSIHCLQTCRQNSFVRVPAIPMNGPRSCSASGGWTSLAPTSGKVAPSKAPVPASPAPNSDATTSSLHASPPSNAAARSMTTRSRPSSTREAIASRSARRAGRNYCPTKCWSSTNADFPVPLTLL